MAALVAAVAVVMALAVQDPGLVGVFGFMFAPPLLLATVWIRYLRRTDDIRLPPSRQSSIIFKWAIWFLVFFFFLWPLVFAILFWTWFALFR
jgi:hypothetical protein